MGKKLSLILIVVLVMALTSCNLLTDEWESLNMGVDFKEQFNLRIPTDVLIKRGASFIEIEVTNNDNKYSDNKTLSEYDTYILFEFKNIVVGTYSITINIYDDENNNIGSGTTSTSITKNSTSFIDLNVNISEEKPNSGELEVGVNITMESNSNNRGIFIGINNYFYSNSLTYASSDADILYTSFNQTKNNLSATKLQDIVYKSDIMEEINSTLANTEFLVFSFSGHGVYHDGVSKISMSDIYDGSNNEAIITAIELKNAFSHINNATIFIIIDACQSGDFIRGEDIDNFNQGFIDVFNEASARSSNEYIVITGSSKTGYSYESSWLEHGFLSYILYDGLGGPSMYSSDSSYDRTFNADLNDNGTITFGELYDYAYPLVMELSSDQQMIQYTNGYDNIPIINY